MLAEIAVRLFDLSDSVAAPSATLGALVHGMSSGTLSGELGTTLASYVQGFALAVAVGVSLGIAIGSSRTIADATAVVIEFLRPIPAVALIPLAILVLGLGAPMLRFVIAYAAVWPIYGVRGVDRMLYDVAATSGVRGASRIVRVTVPAALPSIATGIVVPVARVRKLKEPFSQREPVTATAAAEKNLGRALCRVSDVCGRSALSEERERTQGNQRFLKRRGMRAGARITVSSRHRAEPSVASGCALPVLKLIQKLVVHGRNH